MQSPSDNAPEQGQPTAELWECDACGTENAAADNQCATCSLPREDAPEAEPEPEAEPPAWKCAYCEFDSNGNARNTEADSKCQRCLKPRDYSGPSQKENESRAKAAEGRKSVGGYLELDSTGLAEGLRKLGYGWRFNVRRGKPELRALADADADWKPLDDHVEGAIRDKLQRDYICVVNHYAVKPTVKGWWMSNERWKAACDALWAESEVDPFKEWLDGLEEWDGKPRLDALLESCFDIDPEQDREVLEWASRSTILTAIARTYEPGFAQHEMPVLVGAQRVGKGTFCQGLLPPKMRDWGHKELAFERDAKRMREDTEGGVIVEWNELSGIHATDRERMKAWLSRNSDTARMAYAHFATDAARRFALIATANDTGAGILPQDTSGYRRFVVVKLGGNVQTNHHRVRRYLDFHRDQLYAEALQRYRNNGESGRLPDHLHERAQETAKAAAYRDDVTDERVKEALPFVTQDADDGQWLSLKDLKERMAEDSVPSDPKAERLQLPKDGAIINVLKELGAERDTRRINGRLRKGWLLPNAPAHHDAPTDCTCGSNSPEPMDHSSDCAFTTNQW